VEFPLARGSEEERRHCGTEMERDARPTDGRVVMMMVDVFPTKRDGQGGNLVFAQVDAERPVPTVIPALY
jgi:hypothetical protein